ncbi:cytochrome P450 [Amycolatopsis sp. NPDC023774]|uniref:cytochrome P450 n=1 Tax=Amycolatopsis sp. NPDC023774 TaxID=3155015 RepID=UPI0033FE95C3
MPADAPVEEGDFSKRDGPERVRFRQVFAPAITTVRRSEEFRPMVRRTADELLHGLAGEAVPIDLHEQFSKPLTASVTAELLGVPYSDHGRCQRVAETLFSGDTEIAGQPIAAGEYVIVAVQAANHDPERFPEPERLDIERRTSGHLGFGHGPHQCVGRRIARLELTTALAALSQRVPTLRRADCQPSSWFIRMAP